MRFTSDQIKAVARIANLFGDSWMIGAEAARIKREHKLTDKDIVFILHDAYGHFIAESTIQNTRVMHSIFGDERVAGCGFSHHHVAAIAARTELGLRGVHDLSEDQCRDVRTRASEILETAKGAYGPEPTVDDVRCLLEHVAEGCTRSGKEAQADQFAVGRPAREDEGPSVQEPATADATREAPPPAPAEDPAPAYAGPATRDGKSEVAGATPTRKTTPASPARQRQRPKAGRSGQQLLKQLERQIARASGRQKKRLLVSVVDMVQSALATLDPDEAAEIVDRIRAPMPAETAA